MFTKIFFTENRGFYEIKWKDIVQPERPQITIQHGVCALNAT